MKRTALGEDEGDQVASTKKGKQKKPKPDIEVLKHKTFHRYTSTCTPIRLRNSAFN